MEYRDLRRCVWQALKEGTVGRADSATLDDLSREAAMRARTMGLIETGDRAGPESPYNPLDKADEPLLVRVFWDLVAQRILAPGQPRDPWKAFPFFHITEYGRRCLESDDILYYDPWGYGENVAKIAADMDEEKVIQTYAAEAVRALGANCHLAAAVMVGVASERALEILFEAFASALPAKAQESFGRVLKKPLGLRQRYKEFLKRLQSSPPPRDLSEGVERKLNAGFELITTTRNDAGHWRGVKVERDDVEDNLIFLRRYLKLIARLVHYYRDKAGPADAPSTISPPAG